MTIPDSSSKEGDTLREYEPVSSHEAGRRLGITAQSVGVWMKKPGAPVGIKGARTVCLWPRFPRWYVEQLVASAKRESAGKRSSDDPRDRKDNADADLKELELAERKGQLVPREEAEGWFADACMRVRGRLLSLPHHIASRVVGLTYPERLAQGQALADEVMAELQGPTEEEAE